MPFSETELFSEMSSLLFYLNSELLKVNAHIFFGNHRSFSLLGFVIGIIFCDFPIREEISKVIGDTSENIENLTIFLENFFCISEKNRLF